MVKLIRILRLMRSLLIYPGIKWSDEKFIADLNRWIQILNINEHSRLFAFALLMAQHKEFRNLFIYRNKNRPFFRRVIALIYKPLDSLYIEAVEIDGGLFIQHGFATMIAAKSIGKNCWINQQVTIGYRGNAMQPPVIKDNVTITCGAKVLGNIVIESNAIIGANAVVIHDVEEGAVMAGVPTKRIK